MKRKDGLYYLNPKEQLAAKEARKGIRALKRNKGREISIFLLTQDGLPPYVIKDTFMGIEDIRIITRSGMFELVGYSRVVEEIIGEGNEIIYRRPNFKFPNNRRELIKMTQIILGDKVAQKIKKKLEKK